MEVESAELEEDRGLEVLAVAEAAAAMLELLDDGVDALAGGAGHAADRHE